MQITDSFLYIIRGTATGLTEVVVSSTLHAATAVRAVMETIGSDPYQHSDLSYSFTYPGDGDYTFPNYRYATGEVWKTWEAWVKPSADVNRYDTYTEKIWEATQGTDIYDSAQVLSDGTFRFSARNGSFYYTKDSSQLLTAGIWSHIGLIRDFGYLKMYINGQQTDHYTDYNVTSFASYPWHPHKYCASGSVAEISARGHVIDAAQWPPTLPYIHS